MSRRRRRRLCAAVCALAAVLSIPSKAQLQDLYRIHKGSFASHVEYHDVVLGPGKELTLADISGPRKITYFYYTEDGFAHRTEGSGFMYPGLVLKIFWDDAQMPSVQVPLWSFFGAFDRKTTDYQSMVMQINHYCYTSYLPMPFSARARFVLAKDGNQTYSRSVAWGIDYEKSQSFASERSRLHAAWNRSKPDPQWDASHARRYRDRPIRWQFPPGQL